MDNDVFELSQKIKRLKSKLDRCNKKYAELEKQMPQALELEEKLSSLQSSQDPRERGKYVDAHCKRVLLQASLTNLEAERTSTAYELKQITDMQNELAQNQPQY